MITVGNDLVRDNLHHDRKWFIILGILLIISSFALFSMLAIANIAVVYSFGILMMIGGVLQLFASLFLFKTDSRWFWALFSIFYFMAGYFAFTSPIQTAIALAVLLAIFMMFAGGARMAYATMLRAMPGWGWTFFSGLLTFLTGLLILITPDSPFWVLGMFLAVDVLFQGINYLAIANVIKKLPESSQTVE